MRNRLYLSLFVVSLLVIFLSLALWTTQGQGGSAPRQTWEIKVLAGLGPTRVLEDGQELPGSPQLLSRANALSVQGWELVSVAWHGSGYALWFKRPK